MILIRYMVLKLLNTQIHASAKWCFGKPRSFSPMKIIDFTVIVDRTVYKQANQTFNMYSEFGISYQVHNSVYYTDWKTRYIAHQWCMHVYPRLHKQLSIQVVSVILWSSMIHASFNKYSTIMFIKYLETPFPWKSDIKV